MIKHFIFISLLVSAGINGICQSQEEGDKLKHELAIAKTDTSRVLLFTALCNLYRDYNSDTSISYGQAGLDLANKISFLRGQARILNELGLTLRIMGDIPKSLELQYKGLQIAEQNHYHSEIVSCLRGIGIIYLHELDDYPKAINYFLRQLEEVNRNPNEGSHSKALAFLNLGIAYQRNNQLDSGLFYLQKSLAESRNMPIEFAALYYYGDIQFKLGNHPLAFECLRKSISLIKTETEENRGKAEVFTVIARFFKETNQPDSGIYYAKNGLATAMAIGYKRKILENATLLADMYETKDIRQAYYYLQVARSVNDEMFGSRKIQRLQKAISEEQQRQLKTEAERIAYENQLKQNAFLGGLVILLLIAFILYRNNKQKQKANALLYRQKEEIQSTLTQLKVTQAQLIQSEKMASLGELTAGIAHEIQNPLNFVNNFSEVNAELIDEMRQEMDKGNYTDAKELSADIKGNEEKIKYHGKRADAIVKGMLQHSQSSSGVKELMDINSLADEYLRLSYHGFLARDSALNVTMTTDFDKRIGKINIIPQDIGRVLLNLYNNALYAVNEKWKQEVEGYAPFVSVSTKKSDEKILISIKDNGNGIPQKIVHKIFQPFFTTKPTGQGTGLGLSLAYDIVKAHGGELKVETTEKQGSEFIIELPVSS